VAGRGREDFGSLLLLLFLLGFRGAGRWEEFAEGVECCWGEEAGCDPGSFVG